MPRKEKFDREWELDFSLNVRNVGRFRVNVHRQKGTVEAAFRVVSEEIRSLKQLGLPPIVEELCREESGLILITGPTGSGKTTTLAAMIDTINATRSCVIITIEDRSNSFTSHKRSIVKQRELQTDTRSFAAALRHSLRQDPDVIAIGEMRDNETMSTALTAAETGHLVLATIHTARRVSDDRPHYRRFPRTSRNRSASSLPARSRPSSRSICCPSRASGDASSRPRSLAGNTGGAPSDPQPQDRADP